eukprot:g5991.t1
MDVEYEVHSSSAELMPQRLSMKGVSHQSVLIGKERLTATFRGVGQHSNDVGAVRADRPVPLTRRAYYYEITVLNAGEKGKIGIGFADGEFKLQRQPGWEPRSYGYHGDDGKKFATSESGSIYGPKFGTNDVIGAGIHLENRQMFFTKNGTLLGIAFNNVEGELYPTIGLHSKSESVEVNFGQKPFVFDIQGMLQEEKSRLQNEIRGSVIAPTTVDDIVRRYLYHYGYSSTLNAFDEFNARTGTNEWIVTEPSMKEDDVRALEFRKNMRQMILKGQIDEVLELLEKRCPELLVLKNADVISDVLFFLLCQKFIELVRGGFVENAVHFAQKELFPFRDMNEKYRKELHWVIALVAYKQPEDPTLKYLFSKERRDFVADVVNSALLRLSPSSKEADVATSTISTEEPITAVEKILKQLVTTHKQLHEENKNQGEVFRLQDHLFE